MPETRNSNRPAGKEGPSLPAAQAFVLQFGVETDVQRRRFSGRVEHLESGRSVHFHSPDEILEFVADVLAQLESPAGSA